MGLLKRPAPAGDNLAAEAIALDPLSSSHPALVQFLTLGQWDDGAVRKLGTVKLFVQEGKFKAFLNCHDTNRYACVSADSLGGLLDCLEAALLDGDVEWRASNWNGKPSAKK